MKIFTLLLCLFSSYAFADITQSFNLNIANEISEKKVVELAQGMIEQIEAGKNKVANRYMEQKNCWPINKRYIKVTGLTVSKYYENVDGTFAPKFYGSISFKHTACSEHW